MKNIKQIILLAGLSTAFLSCSVQAMETPKDEMPEALEEILALILGNQEETTSEMPSFKKS